MSSSANDAGPRVPSAHPAPLQGKGPKVTIPEAPNLTLNNRRDNLYAQKFDQTYLSKLKGVEHKQFLETVKNKNNEVQMENLSYQQAVNQLHDQLYGLNLEDFSSKVKVKRRIY